MQLGMIGLGRMGGNMVERLMRHGHQCDQRDRPRQSAEQNRLHGCMVPLAHVARRLMASDCDGHPAGVSSGHHRQTRCDAAALERDLLPEWLGRGVRVSGFRSSAPFIDIGTPASYAAAEEFFRQQSPEPHCHA